MKKYFIIMAMLFLAFLNAEDVYELKIWKLFRIREKSILITNNLDVWELNYLRPNEQTWGEWISRTPAEELFGNEYIYQHKLWNEQSIVLCSDYPWINCYESKIYRHDNSDLSLCTHILENKATEEKAFARRIDTKDWKEIYKRFNGIYCVDMLVAHEEAIELQAHEKVLFKFILRLIKGKSEFTVNEILNNDYESFEEKELELLFLIICGNFEALEDDEYSKYVDFENSFGFCSTILSVNEQCPQHMRKWTFYGNCHSYLQGKYKAFRDEQKLSGG